MALDLLRAFDSMSSFSSGPSFSSNTSSMLNTAAAVNNTANLARNVPFVPKTSSSSQKVPFVPKTVASSQNVAVIPKTVASSQNVPTGTPIFYQPNPSTLPSNNQNLNRLTEKTVSAEGDHLILFYDAEYVGYHSELIPICEERVMNGHDSRINKIRQALKNIKRKITKDVNAYTNIYCYVPKNKQLLLYGSREDLNKLDKFVTAPLGQIMRLNDPDKTHFDNLYNYYHKNSYNEETLINDINSIKKIIQDGESQYGHFKRDIAVIIVDSTSIFSNNCTGKDTPKTLDSIIVNLHPQSYTIIPEKSLKQVPVIPGETNGFLDKLKDSYKNAKEQKQIPPPPPYDNLNEQNSHSITPTSTTSKNKNQSNSPKTNQTQLENQPQSKPRSNSPKTNQTQPKKQKSIDINLLTAKITKMKNSKTIGKWNNILSAVKSGTPLTDQQRKDLNSIQKKYENEYLESSEQSSFQKYLKYKQKYLELNSILNI